MSQSNISKDTILTWIFNELFCISYFISPDAVDKTPAHPRDFSLAADIISLKEKKSYIKSSKRICKDDIFGIKESEDRTIKDVYMKIEQLRRSSVKKIPMDTVCELYSVLYPYHKESVGKMEADQKITMEAIKSLHPKTQEVLNHVLVDAGYENNFNIEVEKDNVIFGCYFEFGKVDIIFQGCDDIAGNMAEPSCIIGDFVLKSMDGQYRVEFSIMSHGDYQHNSFSFNCKDISYGYQLHDYKEIAGILPHDLTGSIVDELNSIRIKASVLGEDVLSDKEKELLKAYPLFHAMAGYNISNNKNFMTDHEIDNICDFLTKQGFEDLAKDFRVFKIARSSLSEASVKKARKVINKKLRKMRKNKGISILATQTKELIYGATKDLPPNPRTIINNLQNLWAMVDGFMANSGFKGSYPYYTRDRGETYQYVCLEHLHSFHGFTDPIIDKYSIGLAFGIKDSKDDKTVKQYKSKDDYLGYGVHLVTDFTYLAHTGNLEGLEKSINIYMGGVEAILDGKKPSKEFLDNEMVKGGYYKEMKMSNKIMLFAFLGIETILGLALALSPIIDRFTGEEPSINAVYIGIGFLFFIASIALWYVYNYLWRNKHPKFLR